MTTATTSFGQIVAPGARMILNIADGMLNGITKENFGRKPQGVDCNTPAFVFGHLSIYPEMILQMLGREDLAQPNEKYESLFKHGVDCVDDPDNTNYPPMDEILERFRTRTNAAIDAFEQASDETMAMENPNENMRDRFPTVGVMCEFLLNGHSAFHLGQVSTWRRCMCMGSAMG